MAKNVIISQKPHRNSSVIKGRLSSQAVQNTVCITRIVTETHRLLMLQPHGTKQKISVRKWEKSPDVMHFYHKKQCKVVKALKEKP